MPHLPVLGIDIAKASFEVAYYDGTHYHPQHFANTPAGFRALSQWLADQLAPPRLCCLEATGRYGEALACFLVASGRAVAVVNPARLKAYARSRLQRNKTDALDAQLIAHFAATQDPPLWQPPSAAQRTLRERVRHRTALEQMRQAEYNRLLAGVQDPLVQQHIQQHITFLSEQLGRLEQEIAALCAQAAPLAEQTRLLCSIPGIGLKTATVLLAELGDLSHFTRAAEVAAYAGLTPRRHESGSSVRGRTRLAKTGNATVRKALYFPALSALRHNPLVRAQGERLAARGKAKLAIVGAAQRKLLHLVFGVLKHRQPFDPHYASVAVT